jgi:hypothetical protein
VTTRDLALIALLLIVASVVFYASHYLIFHDAHHIFIYLLGDVAFVPLEVLLVTLVVDRLLAGREQRSRAHKMNMVIGTFFSVVGQRLLDLMADLAADQEEISAHLAIDTGWGPHDILAARTWVERTEFNVIAHPEKLAAIRDLLAEHRDFLVRLLENPVLLEHDTFSDVLWAVFHLGEELSARESLAHSPPPDLAHLAGDAERAYTRVLAEWLNHMIHLQRDYPYLYSFSARTNPLRPGARAELA